MLRFTAADGATPPRIVRDFQDPYLELVRLVREATEIEHALLVQYLYASFSVKSRYQAVIGTGGGENENGGFIQSHAREVCAQEIIFAVESNKERA